MAIRPHTLFALLLCVLLASSQTAWAQEPESLRIAVLSGDGAIHNIEQRVVTEPVVEVQDENGRPLQGVKVAFETPPTGPSATFFGASRTLTVTTDENGRATARGLSPNTEEGTYEIDVVATYGSLQTSVFITQTNALAPSGPKPKRKVLGWRLLTAIGAAVAIGVTAGVLRDEDDTATATTISLRNVAVGAPR